MLLNKVGRIAEKHDAISDFFEAGTNGPLAQAIITTLRTALLELDRAGVSRPVKRGLRVLKSFASTVRNRYGELEIAVPDLKWNRAPRTAEYSHAILPICSLLPARLQGRTKPPS